MIRRNFLLILGIMLIFVWGYNSGRRIISMRATAQKVHEAERKLAALKQENQALKKDLQYKNSQEFREEEIRDKLGLAKPGEAVVIVPKKEDAAVQDAGVKKENWEKWRDLVFGDLDKPGM